jgi:hypothetical protein
MAEPIQAPCEQCERETLHQILHAAEPPKRRPGTTKYETLQCGGCGTVSLKRTWTYARRMFVHYYPPPIARKFPNWWEILKSEYKSERSNFVALIWEIYIAAQNELPSLAMMGIRAVLEQLMIAKVGDRGSFGKNLSAFADAGYISTIQHDHLQKVLDAGHAVIHRKFSPELENLNTALDVMEDVFATIYVHSDNIQRMQVPERQTRRLRPK